MPRIATKSADLVHQCLQAFVGIGNEAAWRVVYAEGTLNVRKT